MCAEDPGHSTPNRSPAPMAHIGVCRSALPIPARRRGGGGRWSWWWRRSWWWWRSCWWWCWWWCVEPSRAEEGGHIVVPEAGARTECHGGVENTPLYRSSATRLVSRPGLPRVPSFQGRCPRLQRAQRIAPRTRPCAFSAVCRVGRSPRVGKRVGASGRSQPETRRAKCRERTGWRS